MRSIGEEESILAQENAFRKERSLNWAGTGRSRKGQSQQMTADKNKGIFMGKYQVHSGVARLAGIECR